MVWTEVFSENLGSNWAICTLIFAFVVAFLVFHVKLKTKQPQIPYLVPKSKKEGNLPDITAAGSLHEFLLKLHSEHGDIAAFWWGALYIVSICTPELFKEHRNSSDKPYALYGLYEPLFGSKASAYVNGEEGLQRRRIYDTAFTHKAVGRYLKHFQKIADQMVESWVGLPAAEHIPIVKHSSMFAFRSVLLACFGDSMKDEGTINDFLEGYRVIWDELDLLITEPLTEERAKAIETNRARLRRVTDAIVEKRKDVNVTEDERYLIDIVLQYSSDPELQFDEAIQYVVAGFHTIGNLLAWAIYFMCKNPDIQEEVFQEVKQVLGDDDVNANNLPYLVYTRQVLQEALRCAVIAPWSARVREVPCTLGNYVIPANTPIISALGVASKNPKIFPEPDRFDPSRFDPDKCNARSPFAFVPFGYAGKRNCPAERFSYSETAVFLAAVCRQFRLYLVDGRNIKPVYGFVTHPSEEIWITLEKR